jgi:hypothetical protein
MTEKIQRGTEIVVAPTTKLNRLSHSLAIRQGEALSPESIGYLNINDAKRLMMAAGGRKAW